MKESNLHGENIVLIEELEPKVAPGAMTVAVEVKPINGTATIVWDEL